MWLTTQCCFTSKFDQGLERHGAVAAKRFHWQLPKAMPSGRIKMAEWCTCCIGENIMGPSQYREQKIMNDHGSTLKDHAFFQLVVSVTGLWRFLLHFQLGSHGFTSRHEHLACGQTASFRAWMLIKKMRFVGVTMGDHPGYSSIFQLLRWSGRPKTHFLMVLPVRAQKCTVLVELFFSEFYCIVFDEASWSANMLLYIWKTIIKEILFYTLYFNMLMNNE